MHLMLVENVPKIKGFPLSTVGVQMGMIKIFRTSLWNVSNVQYTGDKGKTYPRTRHQHKEILEIIESSTSSLLNSGASKTIREGD